MTRKSRVSVVSGGRRKIVEGKNSRRKKIVEGKIVEGMPVEGKIVEGNNSRRMQRQII